MSFSCLAMVDIGLTHVALPVTDLERSLAFYATYTDLRPVHRRDSGTGLRVAWIGDGTRPFVVVLIESRVVDAPLRPLGHLGVGCASPERLLELCALARSEGVLIADPRDDGPPVGLWAFLRDPDGHTLELSYGQEIGLASTPTPVTP
ncbi:VOC family protein [Cyanobium gracile]|uniref:Lactoylglutathione lyase-like lyase n=1 Tax=Cyanobium gracile (strain ATCC 27147 / PCC 6307) TaxID=292564 RepID=K9P8N8_CYAGP|nr:VOC family protein [Cyanobium gracile]AFY29475.1 lactoylglutathione lyase-like lyase [Cyanobium gracile PCC 6307]